MILIFFLIIDETVRYKVPFLVFIRLLIIKVVVFYVVTNIIADYIVIVFFTSIPCICYNILRGTPLNCIFNLSMKGINTDVSAAF